MLAKSDNNSFQLFLILSLGQFISQIGSGLSAFGLSVFLFQKTASTNSVAMLILAAFLPNFLLAPIAGILADRYDRRLLMIIADSLSISGLLYILFMLKTAQFSVFKICLAIAVSSTFASLLEPAYKATISDLLTKEEYTKASGIVQLAGAARFLISPLIAGFLLNIWDINVFIFIDISTFIVTVISTFFVKQNIKTSKNIDNDFSLLRDFKLGLREFSRNRAVVTLVLLITILTFFVGFIQVLFNPLLLSFNDAAVAGVIQSIAAMGMLISAIIIGVKEMKRNKFNTLVIALIICSLSFAAIGLRENNIMICLLGFIFFSTIPIINAILDYLIRSNIANNIQGRVWGLIGLISQLGYILAYLSAGYFADGLFQKISNSYSDSKLLTILLGNGNARHIGLLIISSGLLFFVFNIFFACNQEIQSLAEHEKSF